MSEAPRLIVESYDPHVLMMLTDYGPAVGFKIEITSATSPLVTIDLDHWNNQAKAQPSFAEVFAFFQEAAARRTAQALGDGGQNV